MRAVGPDLRVGQETRDAQSAGDPGREETRPRRAGSERVGVGRGNRRPGRTLSGRDPDFAPGGARAPTAAAAASPSSRRAPRTVSPAARGPRRLGAWAGLYIYCNRLLPVRTAPCSDDGPGLSGRRPRPSAPASEGVAVRVGGGRGG